MASVLLDAQGMKIAMIALLAIAGSSQAWAITAVPSPDTGSSLLLLSMGVAVVGAVRSAFRR